MFKELFNEIENSTDLCLREHTLCTIQSRYTAIIKQVKWLIFWKWMWKKCVYLWKRNAHLTEGVTTDVQWNDWQRIWTKPREKEVKISLEP